MPRLTYLDREDIEQIAHKLAARLFTGYGSPLPDFQLLGHEGASALESALGLPRQRYYRTLFDKAGVLLRSLIKNHPLVDGNKRVGMTATVVFLLLNDKMLVASNEEMVDFALRIAAESPDLHWKEIAAWLRKRTIPTSPKVEEVDAVIERLPAEWRNREAVRVRLADYAEALERAKTSLSN